MQLNYTSTDALLGSGNPAIIYFTERDLLDHKKSDDELWGLPAAQKLLRKQQPNGGWIYPSGNLKIRSQTNYNQLETFRNLGFLIEKYNFNNKHPAIQATAKYLFTFQSNEGDFRGIYGNQYTPNYSAGITELLIKAGYGSDDHIKKSLEWLLSIRQDDGGWAIPLRTRNQNLNAISSETTLTPDRSKPSSHMVTGVVLRAFAAHSLYSRNPSLALPAKLLMNSFFKRDKYSDRQDPSFWVKFAFPFWFTDLNSSLDSLSRFGFSSQEPQIQKALKWFVDRQREDGLWDLKLLKTGDKDLNYWVALSICRVFNRFNQNN